MAHSPLRILLVEDNPGDARLLREHLREAGSLQFELTHVERLAEAREKVRTEKIDVVLLDLSLPDAHGLETVRSMLEAAPEAPIIVLTGLDDDATAVQAVQAGAQDFLVKGKVDGGLLVRAVRYARERKRLELERAQLLASERAARTEAEAAVRGRDEILRVVAHDLGNSLSAVMVTARVLERIVPEELSGGKAHRKVANIIALVEQMQRLRQDLMDVAMLEAGQLSIERGPLGAATLIEQTVERYGPVAEEKSITFEVQVEPDLPLLLADESRLLQVLANLVTNALKFTPPGGRIEIGARGQGEEVLFHVRDNGIGIPAENLDRLFDRFWTTKQGNPHGAGLGLAIARGIVEAHGGRIWAESVEGEGSGLFFTVPLEVEGGKGVRS
ncbi:MAG TPA: ATP-binding protein [Longimicrobiaceae bacterium]